MSNLGSQLDSTMKTATINTSLQRISTIVVHTDAHETNQEASMRHPCIGSTMMGQILATDEVNLTIRRKSMTTKISPKIAEKLALLSHTPVTDI